MKNLHLCLASVVTVTILLSAKEIRGVALTFNYTDEDLRSCRQFCQPEVIGTAKICIAKCHQKFGFGSHGRGILQCINCRRSSLAPDAIAICETSSAGCNDTTHQGYFRTLEPNKSRTSAGPIQFKRYLGVIEDENFCRHGCKTEFKNLIDGNQTCESTCPVTLSKRRPIFHMKCEVQKPPNNNVVHCSIVNYFENAENIAVIKASEGAEENASLVYEKSLPENTSLLPINHEFDSEAKLNDDMMMCQHGTGFKVMLSSIVVLVVLNVGQLILFLWKQKKIPTKGDSKNQEENLAECHEMKNKSLIYNDAASAADHHHLYCEIITDCEVADRVYDVVPSEHGMRAYLPN